MIKTTIFTHRPCIALSQFSFCWWRHKQLLMTSQWPDNCDAIMWIVISNSLYIDFIHNDIQGWSCKKLKYVVNGPKSHISELLEFHSTGDNLTLTDIQIWNHFDIICCDAACWDQLHFEITQSNGKGPLRTHWNLDYWEISVKISTFELRDKCGYNTWWTVFCQRREAMVCLRNQHFPLNLFVSFKNICMIRIRKWYRRRSQTQCCFY